MTELKIIELEIIESKMEAMGKAYAELVAEHNGLMMTWLFEAPPEDVRPICLLRNSIDAKMEAIKAEAWDRFKMLMNKADNRPADVRKEAVLKSAANQQEFNEKYLFRTKGKKLPIDMPPYSSNVPVNFYANAMKQAHADSLNIHTRVANLETRVTALEGEKKS